MWRQVSIALGAAAVLAAGGVSAQEGTPSPVLGDEPPAPMVVGVEIHLPPGTDPTGIAEQVAVPRHQPLSKQAVRRSIERLYLTNRFSDIVVRQVPAEGGVRIIFEVTPKQKIAGLDVDGEKVLTEEEILEASRIAPGEEFYPELLEQAEDRVRALYHQRGYRAAKVSASLHELEGGMSVLLMVEEGAPTRVAGVTVAGNPGLPIPKVVEAVGLPPGSVLDLTRLEAGLERLKAQYRQERFYRARVGEPEILDGPAGSAYVALPVDAGPRYQFHFRGNHNFADRLLEGVLGYDGSEMLDRSVMDRMARRVANFYRYRGFHHVRVMPREVRTPNHAKAVLAFDIDEGRQLFVRNVRFEGNEALPEELLRRILAEQITAMAPVPRGEVPALDDPLEIEGRTRGGSRPPTPEPAPLTVYVPEAYEEATRTIRDAYRERGYLSAAVRVRQVSIDVNSQTADATFEIDEGPQALVREVKYLGLPEGFDPSPVAALKEGAPFRFSGVDETVRAVIRALGRKGYLFARAEGESSVAPGGRDAWVTFRIRPGPKVRVGRVIIRGISRTDEAMLRANLVVEEGGVLDPEALFESQRNLVLLGVFRSVAVRLLDPDRVEATKDVVVDVRERPRLSGEFSGGYSLVDGPRVIGDLAYPNIGGFGTSLTARLKLNYIGASALVLSERRIDPEEVQGLDGIDGRFNVAITQPRVYSLLPLRLGLRGDLIGERVHRPSFNFLRVAGVGGADWSAANWLTVSLQYEAEHYQVRLSESVRRLSRLGDPDLERYRFQSGNFSLHSIRPAVTLDFRDDITRPSRGLLVNGTAELTQDLGAALLVVGTESSTPFPIYTLKVAGNVTGYVPIAPRVTLALSARGGKIFHLLEDSRSIAPKRFYMGGGTSMRGFREDGIIPEDRRAELKRDLYDCRALVLPVGCSPEAELLDSGQEVPSEGGEIFTLAKGELRFPVFGSFDLGVFLEAGNLWLDQAQYEPFRLRYVAGAGVRYGTPIGPIALDLGVNLVPDLDVNEPRANLHFSIGLF